MAVELVDVVNPETGRIATVSAESDAAKEWKRPPSQRDALPTTFDNTTPADLAAQADETAQPDTPTPTSTSTSKSTPSKEA